MKTEANELLRRNKIGVRPKFIFITIFKPMIKTTFETMFKPCSKLCSKPCLKKNIAYKLMSFLKITYQKKTDFIVNEFLKTRQSIQ